MRETDVVARWGGEEFLIVLYNATIESIKCFSERLHSAISTILLPYDKPIAVSIGGAVLDQNGLAHSDVIASQLLKADEALYSAKENQKGHTRIIDESGEFLVL